MGWLADIRQKSGLKGRFRFTEVLVALIMLTVLSSVTARFVMDMETDREKDLRQAREGIMLISSALGAYAFDLGKPPPLSEKGGLNTLVDAGYFETVPKDPWGRAYQYQVPPVQSGMPFDLYSLGPDGIESDDDVVNWNLYGKRYRGTSRISRKRTSALEEASTRREK